MNSEDKHDENGGGPLARVGRTELTQTTLGRFGITVARPARPAAAARDEDGELIAGGWVSCVVLGERWLAVGGLDGEVRLLSRSDLELVKRFRLPSGAVQAMAFDAAGRLLVGGADGEVRMFDANAGNLRPIRLLQGVDGAGISALVPCVQRGWLYIADLGGAIRVFDAQLKPLPAQSADAGETVYDLAVDSARDCLYVVTVAGVSRLSVDSPLALLPGGEGRRLRALVATGRWLCGSGDEPGVAVWDLEDGGAPRQLEAQETVLALAAEGSVL